MAWTAVEELVLQTIESFEDANEKLDNDLRLTGISKAGSKAIKQEIKRNQKRMDALRNNS